MFVGKDVAFWLMNTMIEIPTLFSLEDFAHQDLFTAAPSLFEPLKQLKAYLASQTYDHSQAHISPQATLIHPEQIALGAGTVVEAGAYLVGPIMLGKNCQIRHGAYLRGHVLGGDGVVIGHTSEVKHAIFFSHAKAAHFAYVGDSILGHGVNLGAGTKLANFRFDGQHISCRMGSEKIPTGLRKLGALLGDGANTGCNSVTNPGTIFLPKSFCYPCANVRGVVYPS